MSTDRKPDPTPEAATAPEPAVEAPGAEPAAPPSEAVARHAELEGQIKDLTDRLLRAHAEMDNMRKRSERERGDTAKYAITKFAGDMVTFADNLQRAIEAVPATDISESGAVKSMVEGVRMTEREFQNVLGRHGVRRVDPKGEPFNPHQHQAVMKQQNAEVPAGTVLQVFQAGYMIEDRVLRPAMVVVAEGGFKAVKPPAADASPAPGADEGSAGTTSD